MEVYVYSRSSFSFLARAAASSWDLPLASYQAASGSVVVAGELSPDYKDNWLLAGGEVWIIDRVEPKDGVTTITVAPGIDAFDRPISLPSPLPTTVGDLILQALQDNFQSPADPVYAMPYLELATTAGAPAALPTLSEAGLWTLPDYIRAVQDAARVRLRVRGNFLRAEISPAEPTVRTVFMDGDAELLQQTYSRQFTAKVTVVQSTGASDYYVDAAGAVSASPPEPRLAGEWRVVETRDNKPALEAAQEVFSENVAANKIAFSAAARYNLGDIVRTRLGDQPASVKVTAVRQRSTDRRYYYECGELATSLSERLAASESIAALGGVSSRGGSVDGNLGILGAVSAEGGLTVSGGAAISGSLTAKGMIILGPDVVGTELPTTDLVDGRLFVLLEE